MINDGLTLILKRQVCLAYGGTLFVGPFGSENPKRINCDTPVPPVYPPFSNGTLTPRFTNSRCT